jgi:hypothetical protein
MPEIPPCAECTEDAGWLVKVGGKVTLLCGDHLEALGDHGGETEPIPPRVRRTPTANYVFE